MAFIQVSGPTKMEPVPVGASTTFVAGQACILTSGVLADATTSTTKHVGVLPSAVASTDADYASAKTLQVISALPETVFEGDIGSGTYSATLIGTQCDLASATTVAVQTNSHHQLTIVGAGSSSTKVLVKFNSYYDFANAS